MKEKEFSQTKLFFALLAVLVFYFLISSLPVSAADVPIIQVKEMPWTSQGGSFTYFLPDDFPSDIGAIMIISKDKKQTYAFFYSTHSFSQSVNSNTSSFTVTSERTPYNGFYYQVAAGYCYGTVTDKPEYYHSTFDKGESTNIIHEVIDDIVAGRILTNGKMDVSDLFPKEFYNKALGSVVFEDGSFSEVNLHTGITTDDGNFIGRMFTDKEYIFKNNRYSSTGVDLLYKRSVLGDHSDGTYSLIMKHIFVSPDIYLYLKDGSYITLKDHRKTFDLGNNHVGYKFDQPFKIKLSELMDLIPESLSQIEDYRSLLANTSDAVTIKWKIFFKLEGHLRGSKDIEYGDIVCVSINSNFNSRTYDETPTISYIDGVFDDNGKFIANEDSHSTTVQGSASEGVSWDEGYSNLDSIKPDHNSSVIDSAESLLSQIGSLPSIISTLFSFFPSWVLGLYATGFGFLIVLILYKLARG